MKDFFERCECVIIWLIDIFLLGLTFIGFWLLPIVHIDLVFFHYGLLDMLPVKIYLYFEASMLIIIIVLIILDNILHAIFD